MPRHIFACMNDVKSAGLFLMLLGFICARLLLDLFYVFIQPLQVLWTLIVGSV